MKYRKRLKQQNSSASVSPGTQSWPTQGFLLSSLRGAFETNSSKRTSPDMDWRKGQALGKLQASCHEYSLHAKIQMTTTGKKLCCSFSNVVQFTFSSHSAWLLQWVYSYSTGNPDRKYVCFLNFTQWVCWTISPKTFHFFLSYSSSTSYIRQPAYFCNTL